MSQPRTFYTVIAPSEEQCHIRSMHPVTGEVTDVAESFADPEQARQAFTRSCQGKTYSITNAELAYIVAELKKVIIVPQLPLRNGEILGTEGGG